MRMSTKATGVLLATTALFGLGAGVALADAPAQAATPNQITVANNFGGKLIITNLTDAAFWADAPRVGTTISAGSTLPMDLDYDATTDPRGEMQLEAYSAAGKDLGSFDVWVTGGRSTGVFLNQNSTTLAATTDNGTFAVLPAPATTSVNVTLYNKSDKTLDIAGYQQTVGNQLKMWQLADPAGTTIAPHGSETFPASFSSAVATNGAFTVNELNGDGTVFGSLTVDVSARQYAGKNYVAAGISTDSTDLHNTATGTNVVIAPYPAA